MASPGLESSLCRGLVLRLVLDSSVLDDPELTTREKFVVILNHLCPDDPIYFVMAPSKLDRFKSVIHLANEIVTLDPARYVSSIARRPWISRQSSEWRSVTWVPFTRRA